MIDDRKESVDSVRATAQDILSHTDDAAEKQSVASQFDLMVYRWDAINHMATSQEAALKAALKASKDYHDKVEPFSDWLESIEKKAAGLDAASVGITQKQIDEQRVRIFRVRILLCSHIKLSNFSNFLFSYYFMAFSISKHLVQLAPFNTCGLITITHIFVFIFHMTLRILILALFNAACNLV